MENNKQETLETLPTNLKTNRIMRKFFATLCILFSFIFGYLETEYFGNNFTPNSKEELLCDIMSFFLFICGVIIYLDNQFKKK